MKLRRTLRKVNEYTTWGITAKAISGLIQDEDNGKETKKAKKTKGMIEWTANTRLENYAEDKNEPRGKKLEDPRRIASSHGNRGTHIPHHQNRAGIVRNTETDEILKILRVRGLVWYRLDSDT